MKKLLGLLIALYILFACKQVIFAEIPTVSDQEKAYAEEIAEDFWKVEKPLYGGILNDRARRLMPLTCPQNVNSSGIVKVFVLIDENGKVEQAEAVAGDYRLFDAAEESLKKSDFLPTSEIGIKRSGFVIYHFRCKSDAETPKAIFVGYVNSQATRFFKPVALSPINSSQNPVEKVRIRVLIDPESGNVIKTKWLSGNPSFQAMAESAAQNTTFQKLDVGGDKLLLIGILTYDFPLTQNSIEMEAQSKEIAVDCGSVPSGGVLYGKVLSLVKPRYPIWAKIVRASGEVNVLVLIGEEGKVLSATAISGHSLLRASAESAARLSRFTPTILSGQSVKISNTIIYTFAPNRKSVGISAVNTSNWSAFQRFVTLRETRRILLESKFNKDILGLLKRLENNQDLTEFDRKFVEDGKAKIYVSLKCPSADSIEKLKQLGFEIVTKPPTIVPSPPTLRGSLIGRIATGNLIKLAEIENVGSVSPNLN